MDKFYKIILKKNNTELASKVKLCENFMDRLLGLMFTKEMIGYDGLILEPCKSIHNFFVKFPIDVIFLTKKNEVVKVIKNFKPWDITRIYFDAYRVIELKQGAINTEVLPGDQLEVINV